MKEPSPGTLVIDGGYASWRTQALRALQAAWPPEALTWADADAVAGPTTAPLALDCSIAVPDSSDGQVPASCPDGKGAGPQIRISKDLATLLQDAAQYRSPQRWAVLYRVLWRWCHGDRAVASAADEDGARLHAMAKSVRRARHDMIAYVRFQRRSAPGLPEYIAWYEPEHDVLAYAAEHFARRMGTSTWSIGTPHGAALWDGQTLRFSNAPEDAAVLRANDATDGVETLWLAYYRNIFNPARLNESALRQHMPVRFWKGLPEGTLIPGMIANARQGARRVAQAGTIGDMPGRQVAVPAERALPQRPPPSSLDQCRRCELWRHATQPVPGSGPESARIMMVGEQPGDQEDLAGAVFVGPAGQVLDEAFRQADVQRDSVFITNAVKHFKWVARGKRRLHKTPGQLEVDACAHWLKEEMARVRPAVIVALGATALRAIVGRKVNMRDAMAAPIRLGDTWILATWHPSYALRVGDAVAREDVVGAIAQTVVRAYRLAMSAEAFGREQRSGTG
jgi:DNA polymerase